MAAAETPPVVQKYGGSSVADTEHLRRVARRIARRAEGGDQVVVVVSAMGTTTDELVALARQITPHPEGRDYDMLLASGEMASVALLAMALRDLGHPAIGLTGAQAGVYTDDTFNRARITRVNADRISVELEREHVVIIAGFQGGAKQADLARQFGVSQSTISRLYAKYSSALSS